MKTNFVRLFVGFCLALGMLGITPADPAHAAGFVVNTNIDDSSAHDTSPGNGICMDMLSRGCTLRAAIEEANALLGADTITFASAMVITINTSVGALPDITDALAIDGSSAYDYTNNKPGVELNGNGGSFTGLRLWADGRWVSGLYITNFNGTAIDIRSANNVIGGAAAGRRNVISGNTGVVGYGIYLAGAAAHDNRIENNYIGVTPAGNAQQANSIGIGIFGGATRNTIGGLTVAERNVISGNTYQGVYISDAGTDSNALGGNYIGVGADGATAIGNGDEGVAITMGAGDTYIGSVSPVGGNLIALNGKSGVYVANVTGITTLENNTIRNNAQNGVSITGSGCKLYANIITNNAVDGVWIEGSAATGNTITGGNSIYNNNYLGIDLNNGGNIDRAAPVISSATAGGASGTVSGCPNCQIEIFSDSNDEGQTYHASVTADGSGNWSYSGALSGPNVTATATDTGGNTSEFSAPFNITTTFTLTITGTGNGNGTVTASGINCAINAGVASGDCSEAYPANTLVTLTAVPDPNSTFLTWAGDCISNEVSMDTDKNCVAGFVLLPTYHTLTMDNQVMGNGTGTVTASGINCQILVGSVAGDCSETYPENTLITLTAVPDPGSTFVVWSGDCDLNGQVSMDADKNCRADFVLTPVYHTVTVIGAGNGNGTVIVGPVGGPYWVDCTITAGSASGDCAETFISTTWAWLTANANPDSTFDGWSGDCDATGMVTLEADKTCIAVFNLANSAPTDITLSNNSVAENLPAGTLVGTLSTTDSDAGDTHTYSFCGGADDASFQIGGSDLLTNAAFDFETKNSYDICIRADDGNGGSLDKTFTITVMDVVETLTATFSSVGTHDGWILESSEISNAGGTLNTTATTFNLGDNNLKKQYRGILSFSTGARLPDTAVITKVTLKVKRQGLIGGGNPVSIFQGFMVDIKKGFFGTAALQTSNFQAATHKTYGPFMTALSGGWYSIDLTPGKGYINKLSTLSGLTQIRLRFKLDDNNNAVANYLSLYSGNAGAASRPQLIIEYYTP